MKNVKSVRRISLLCLIVCSLVFSLNAQEVGSRSQQTGESELTATCEPVAAIFVGKMNILYADIPNSIFISSSVGYDQLRVSFPGCEVTSRGEGKYEVKVPSSLIGERVEATVSTKWNGSTKQLYERAFFVKAVPSPKARLGANIRGGICSKEKLLDAPLVRVSMNEDFIYDVLWKVVAYKVIFVTNGVEEPAIVSSGAAFSDMVKEKIEKAPSSTIIFFTDIKVSSEVGTRYIDDVVVRIK